MSKRAINKLTPSDDEEEHSPEEQKGSQITTRARAAKLVHIETEDTMEGLKCEDKPISETKDPPKLLCEVAKVHEDDDTDDEQMLSDRSVTPNLRHRATNISIKNIRANTQVESILEGRVVYKFLERVPNSTLLLRL
jgi:hypothetical protein